MISVKVSNRRLLKLADYLETVPRKDFDYSSWTQFGSGGCALGHAATMPCFRRLGLRLLRGVVPIWGNPEDLIRGFEAAEQCFGLVAGEGIYLFGSSQGLPDGTWRFMSQVTPKQVARKIRRFVASRAS